MLRKQRDDHVCKIMELLSLKNVLMIIGNLIHSFYYIIERYQKSIKQLLFYF